VTYDKDRRHRIEHAYACLQRCYSEADRGVPCEKAMDVDLAILTSRCIDARVDLARSSGHGSD
jgi:hypothetical protein